MKSNKNRNNKHKSKPNLQKLSLEYYRFQIGCLFAEFDLFKPTSFIQNCININFRINLTKLYINFSR